MRPLLERLLRFSRWFWSGAHPGRQWRYFVGARRAEHAKMRAYHLRFVPFALSQSVLGLPWIGAALVAPRGKTLFLVLGALKIVGGGALAGALVRFLFPIRVNEREVRGRTFIGLARRVAWSDVESVRLRRWLFTSFAVVASRGERTLLWMPLFLCQQREFEAQIQGWLAPDHPLRVFLEGQRNPPLAEVASCPTS